MKLYETNGRVGLDGVLTLHHLPFPNGDEVKVRVESATETATACASFVFGLHTGLVTVSEDFDAALPDSFWLGQDEDWSRFSLSTAMHGMEDEQWPDYTAAPHFIDRKSVY